MAEHLDPASAARFSALNQAPHNRWVALSSDESRVVADSDTFEGVVTEAERRGELDPLIVRVPQDWTPRVL